ncbi:MAG: periplasmic heavy metal sensor [Amylibacter sp.]
MSDIPPKSTPLTKGRNWTRIALLVSLALNLVIVGALVGAFWKNEKPTGRHLDRMSMGLGAYVRALPEPVQSDVMALVGTGSEDRRNFRRAMRERQQKFERVLLEKPFSEQAVRAALMQRRDFALDKTVRLQDAYVNALVAMSDAERPAHFDQAQELLEKRRKGKRRKKRD